MILGKLHFISWLLPLTAMSVVLAANAQENDLRVELLADGIPVVEVATEGAVEPTYELADPPEGCWGQSIKNATRVPGRVCIWLPDGSLAYDSGNYAEGEGGMMIKVRGNGSGRVAKKPYKMKLVRPTDLLRRGNELKYGDRNWLLLHDEQVSLNIAIGLKVNELFQMTWTPAYEYVHVVMNGDYKGLYLLMESVEWNPNCRLDVDKKTGNIVEYDAYWWNSPLSFCGTLSYQHLRYTFKYPDAEDVTSRNLEYITEAVRTMERSIDAGTYMDFIDVRSFASWLLAHDLLGDTDIGGSNMFFAKYDNTPLTKFVMTNLWDFDTIMRQNDAWSQLHHFSESLFCHLFQSPDKTFSRTFSNIWLEKREAICDSMEAFLNGWESGKMIVMDKARRRDAERWPRLYPYHSVKKDVESAKAWFSRRKAWLDEAMATLDTVDVKTTMSTVKVTKGRHGCYDLTGRRLLRKPVKGMYIEDGKLRCVSQGE